MINELEKLEKQANDLAMRLNEGRCREHEGSSCIRAEETRPLDKRERSRGWEMRPYYAYDPGRMCHGCAACWYANMARLRLLDALAIARMVAAEMRDGWHDVTSNTRIFVKDRKPAKVQTTAYDLDGALDAAAHFYGEPLERTGPWLTDDGRDPEDTNTGRHSLVTCKVATAADVHNDKPAVSP